MGGYGAVADGVGGRGRVEPGNGAVCAAHPVLCPLRRRNRILPFSGAMDKKIKENCPGNPSRAAKVRG